MSPRWATKQDLTIIKWSELPLYAYQLFRILLAVDLKKKNVASWAAEQHCAELFYGLDFLILSSKKEQIIQQ